MVSTTTYPGTMPVAFARKARLRAIAFLEVHLEIWWCGYVTVRHDSEVEGSRDSGPRIEVVPAAWTGFDRICKTVSPAKILFGRRSGREGDRRRCG